MTIFDSNDELLRYKHCGEDVSGCTGPLNAPAGVDLVVDILLGFVRLF